jgi:hypothetical protein
MPDAAARLLVAGRPESPELEAELRALAAVDRRILLMLEGVPAERLPGVVAACDLVALPYDELLNSGAALLALSFNRPILVPDRGAMADLRSAVGAEWVKLMPGALTCEVLADSLAEAAAVPASAAAPLDAFEPARIAQMTLDAYHAVRAGRHRAR